MVIVKGSVSSTVREDSSPEVLMVGAATGLREIVTVLVIIAVAVPTAALVPVPVAVTVMVSVAVPGELGALNVGLPVVPSSMLPRSAVVEYDKLS